MWWKNKQRIEELEKQIEELEKKVFSCEYIICKYSKYEVNDHVLVKHDVGAFDYHEQPGIIEKIRVYNGRYEYHIQNRWYPEYKIVRKLICS